MHPALASHLLSEAMDRLNALQDDIDESPDEEQPNDDELDDEDNGDIAPPMFTRRVFLLKLLPSVVSRLRLALFPGFASLCFLPLSVFVCWA
ncbi:uncharacterized protein MELLADRAFT_95749 [Melampsora larici-populina 98AG31]|uniref:Uncharacterized protein n=1 Tax=Melampsora larici-populina (strain 98AG31 / pathotype 3-4-7) TaxID=747676 RepID=F4SAG4_MELLP|nr:uncharacterized protein MELLADRAFT_95749 [Melampsora larici-populina 98AG31]EGF98362.1 hypothetical protein MELLADRAFT_95749 [Melampsora larici-populina 98AG31]